MENPAVKASVGTILADPSRWRTLLNQFEDVLQINIFIVDSTGNTLVYANPQARFGVSLLEKTFGIDFGKGGGDFLSKFDEKGPYFEMSDPFELSLFAIPIREGGAEDPVLYLIVGPVRLNKKSWSDEKISTLATSLGLEKESLLRNIHAVSAMSQPALSAVLDLLSEVVKDVFELTLEKQKFNALQTQADTVRPEIINAVKDLLIDIQQDELLVSVLDAAIKMAGAQGGSLMVYDETKSDFVIKVSRGLDLKKNTQKYRFKIGQGIAGVAAKEKRALFISGTEGDDQIRHLLKRPEIKQSFVVPIVAGEEVIAVLNLSIKDQVSPILVHDVQEDIQKFSPLIAAALRSL